MNTDDSARLLRRAQQRGNDMTEHAAGPTPDGILQLGLGFWGSKTLLSAVELGVFTELTGGPLTLPELKARFGLGERGVQDFFDALVALGMLTRERREVCEHSTD